jgi:DNA-binding NarL/FixJ family response regulator
MQLQVLLANNHAAFRPSLKARVEEQDIAVVVDGPDGRQVLKLGCDRWPNVATLDLSMLVLSGLETAGAHFCVGQPSLSSIYLTGFAGFSPINYENSPDCACLPPGICSRLIKC